MGISLGQLGGIAAGGAGLALGGPLGAGLALGGLGLFGSATANQTNQDIASNATQANILMANNANAVSESMQKESERYDTQMSNTSYQRGVADMKAAGINPMLMGMNASGESSPTVGGGSGQSGSAVTIPVKNELGEGINSGIAAASMSRDLELKGAQKALADSNVLKAIADTKLTDSSAKNVDLKNALMSRTMQNMIKESDAMGAKAGYDYKAAGYDAIMNRLSRESSTAADVSRTLNPLKLFNKGDTGTKPWQGKTPDGTIYDRGTGEIQQP